MQEYLDILEIVERRRNYLVWTANNKNITLGLWQTEYAQEFNDLTKILEIVNKYGSINRT